MSDGLRQGARYIGDGVYASFDGYQIWLQTSDGIRVTNEIALEPAVWASVVEYCCSLRARTEKHPHRANDADSEGGET